MRITYQLKNKCQKCEGFGLNVFLLNEYSKHRKIANRAEKTTVFHLYIVSTEITAVEF